MNPEDAERFNLKAIWDSFHPRQPRVFDDPHWKPAWTVDRERNIFLLEISAGREELSNQVTYVLSMDGELIIAVVAKQPASNVSFKEGVGNCTWELVRLGLPAGTSVQKDAVIRVLKEALTAFGYGGVRRVVPRYEVAFAF